MHDTVCYTLSAIKRAKLAKNHIDCIVTQQFFSTSANLKFNSTNSAELIGIMKDKMIVLVLLCCSVQLAWTSTRHDRVWPISGTTSVDLAQSSPYGPRLKISENSR